MQHEQTELRSQILNILEENEQLSERINLIGRAVPVADSRDDATSQLQLTVAALQSTQKQVELIQAENNELRALHKCLQNVIENLESEIRSYRDQLAKFHPIDVDQHKYSSTIKLLETTVENQKTEIEIKNSSIETLLAQKRQLNERLQQLETSLSEKENQEKYEKKDAFKSVIESLQAKNKELLNLNKELEKSVKESKFFIEKCQEREKNALAKVQEALLIAETAVRDKEESLKREQIVKAECDYLASTIGQVMDEGARKVDQDMTKLRNSFTEKEKLLLESQKNLKDDVQCLKKQIQITDVRCSRLESKNKDIAQENVRLSTELQNAIIALEKQQRLVEVKNKQLIKEDEMAKRRANEQEKQIQNFIKTNRLLKEKYKAAIEEITLRFGKEIDKLQREKTSLIAETQLASRLP